MKLLFEYALLFVHKQSASRVASDKHFSQKVFSHEI